MYFYLFSKFDSMLYYRNSVMRIKMLQSCFQKRRECLASKISLDDGIFIIESAKLQHRNGDVNYSFRQNSNFYYLTGLDEHDAALVLLKDKGKLRSIIFCQDKIYDYEVWHGKVIGPAQAKSQLQVSAAFSISSLSDFLQDNISGQNRIFLLEKEQANLQQKITNILKAKYKNFQPKFSDATFALHEMRLFKDQTEISLIERACDVSCNSHLYAMSHTKPKILESSVEGKILANFMEHGCRQVAYESIVAGGENACTLHYTKNNAVLSSGDLLLIDAGAEHENYASDITRTFPINGKFSPEQKAIYDIVLRAQLEVIAAAKPKVAWSKLQEISELTIIKGLMHLGILNGNPTKILHSGQHKKFYMHGFGHYLGLDVHDVGTYKNKDGSSRLLEPGMVFTVEPGIYISNIHKNVPNKWHNIGIRIEDDILITQNGCRVLTQSLPKDVQDLEHIVGSAYA